MKYYHKKAVLLWSIGTILFLLLGTSLVFSADKPLYAIGVIYHDRNQNQVLDPGEKGIPKIAISNGRDIVQTDKQGKYQIPIAENMILFVIKPTGWTTAFDSNHYPLFYYIYKPNGSPVLKYPGSAPTGSLPASIDFPLYKQHEPNRFKTIFFGDIQITSQQQIDYFAHDVAEEVFGTDAKFIVTLGDNVGDALGLYPPLKETCGRIGVPLYFAMGNHDSNQDAANESFTRETYSSQFGPPYYSFNYGKVHFIILEDIAWREGEGQRVDRHYSCGLGEEQLQFVKRDLELVPKDYLIVLSMHIPINQMAEKNELFRLLEKRKYTFSISGHEHTMEHQFLGLKNGWLGTPEHHHFIGGAVCGSWWIGTQDEYGIPHSMMADGAPNGYTIATFNGNKYSFEYKSARKPLLFQMQLYAPDEITLDENTSTVVQANIFAGSEKSKVEIKFGETGTWMPMEKAALPDQFYAKQYEIPIRKPGWIPRATDCLHMWKKELTGISSKGAYLIQVRETDMFGQVHTGCRMITIK